MAHRLGRSGSRSATRWMSLKHAVTELVGWNRASADRCRLDVRNIRKTTRRSRRVVEDLFEASVVFCTSGSENMFSTV
jgi:hypothetical protein